jgi:hypothetical protein
MIRVTTEWRQQRTVRGKTSQDLLEGETEEFEWPDSVANSITSLLEAHPKLTFSGMEDFGEGGCVLDPVSLRCRAYGDCRHHHMESVREWVEKRVDEMKPGETESFTAGGLKWVSVDVEVLPEPEPEDDPEDDEPEGEPDPEAEKGEPAEAAPAEVPAETFAHPDEGPTYTKYVAFSSEERPIGPPVTHAKDAAETLANAGLLVRARPFYAVPDRPGGLTRARSPFTFEAYVIGTSGADMVKVRWDWQTDSAPWSPTGVFKPEELHDVWTCDCAACHGRIGFQELDGA